MRSFLSLGEDEDSDAAQENTSGRETEDEAEWDRLQADVKGRDPILDPKSKESHIVHAPYFPEVRTDLNVVVLSHRGQFNFFYFFCYCYFCRKSKSGGGYMSRIAGKQSS